MIEIFNSERILVIGPCGAGKSTFSKKLYKVLKLPLIHLDAYYHKPNWQEPEKKDWDRIVKRLANQKKWIMDGNFSDSFDVRIPRSDTIIYLDYSSVKCFLRVLKRNIIYYGRKRSDMAEGCKESFNLAFLKFVLMFNRRNRSNIYNRLETVQNIKNVIILKNDKQVSAFLLQLRKNNIP